MPEPLFGNLIHCHLHDENNPLYYLMPKVDSPGDWTGGIQTDAYSFGQICQIIGNRCPEVCQNV